MSKEWKWIEKSLKADEGNSIYDHLQPEYHSSVQMEDSAFDITTAPCVSRERHIEIARKCAAAEEMEKALKKLLSDYDDGLSFQISWAGARVALFKAQNGGPRGSSEPHVLSKGACQQIEDGQGVQRLLEEAVNCWPEFDSGDEPVNGGDLVDWFGKWRARVKRVIN